MLGPYPVAIPAQELFPSQPFLEVLNALDGHRDVAAEKVCDEALAQLHLQVGPVVWFLHPLTK